VNDVLWHETDSLAGLDPVDRSYITATDDDGKTAVVFGNGQHGSRLPTGVENVRAVYRSGIGKPGNAKAGQISLLATRPLGVKGVINPLPATGGADRENRDQARRNVPLAVLALDRLVSVQDYADFTRTFAGIGKARAAKLSDGRRQVVFITIAGAEDIPIDYHSDLYINLLSALRKFGDPHQQIRVEIRELLLLVISAKVRVKPDYLWDKVEPAVKAALLDTFSFERRDLGQDVLLGEVMSTIQGVQGVEYVDVDVIAGIPEKRPDNGVRRILTPEEIVDEIGKVLNSTGGPQPRPRIRVNLADVEEGIFRPDQIAYLTPDVPDTLILTELKA
jgi:predicted phage baseplate assembly protein